MTASLYQSAVSGSAGCASATATSWLFSRNTEDVRRQRVGVELHEVAPLFPGVVAGGDEIVQLVSVAGRVVAKTRRAMNAGRPPCCRYSCRMSGVFGQTFGRKYSRDGCCASSVKYSVSSQRVLRQVK